LHTYLACFANNWATEEMIKGILKYKHAFNRKQIVGQEPEDLEMEGEGDGSEMNSESEAGIK